MEQQRAAGANVGDYTLSITRKKNRELQSSKLLKLALLLPSLLLIILFSYYPALRSIAGAFTNWNGFNPPSFAGFSNFVEYINSDTFFIELRNIAVLVVGGVFTTVVFPFIAAQLVQSLGSSRFQSISKYLFVVPLVIPQVVLIDIWANLLNPNTGLVDAILSVFGAQPVQWFSGSQTALLSILLIGFPWVSHLSFLIFLAGLQSIAHDIKDASQIDGCMGIRRVFLIDIPLVLPQVQFVVVIAGIGIVQNFVPILLLTRGGPGNATMVPGLDMYNSAFQNNQLGYGMAIGTLLFVAMLIVTSIVLRILRPRT